jgi:hypothetical protein
MTLEHASVDRFTVPAGCPFRYPARRRVRLAVEPTPVGDPPKITCPDPQAVTVTGAPRRRILRPRSPGGPRRLGRLFADQRLQLSGGSTAVSASRDSQLRSASCSFTVTVTVAAPATRVNTTTRGVRRQHHRGQAGPAGFTPDPRFPNSYAGFYGLLVQRYTAQTIDMYDDGLGREGALRSPAPAWC